MFFISILELHYIEKCIQIVYYLVKNNLLYLKYNFVFRMVITQFEQSATPSTYNCRF